MLGRLPLVLLGLAASASPAAADLPRYSDYEARREAALRSGAAELVPMRDYDLEWLRTSDPAPPIRTLGVVR